MVDTVDRFCVVEADRLALSLVVFLPGNRNTVSMMNAKHALPNGYGIFD